MGTQRHLPWTLKTAKEKKNNKNMGLKYIGEGNGIIYHGL